MFCRFRGVALLKKVKSDLRINSLIKKIKKGETNEQQCLIHN